MPVFLIAEFTRCRIDHRIQEKKARFNLFFLDCCRQFISGAPTENLQNTWDNATNTLMCFACGPNQTASDGTGANGMDNTTPDAYQYYNGCENHLLC